jgi:hypothetical protein
MLANPAGNCAFSGRPGSVLIWLACCYFASCLLSGSGNSAPGQNSSTGFIPTTITTAPSGNTNPCLMNRCISSVSPYSCSQWTPNNCGLYGGPKSNCSNPTTAWAASPAVETFGVLMSGLPSDPTANGDSSRVITCTPSIISQFGICECAWFVNSTFHPAIRRAFPIDEANACVFLLVF